MALRISVPRAGVKRPRTTPDGRIAMGKLLGSGAQGQVHVGKVLATRQRVAVKVLPRHSSQARHEVDVLSHLPPHRHIVAVPAGCAIHTSATHVYLPLELAATDMLEALLSSRRFSECDSRRYFLHLVEALMHCHRHGVFHLDVKAENVLLVDGRAVLADFGSSLLCPQAATASSAAGSVRAMADYPSGSVSNAAPEVVRAHLAPYDAAAADVWSLGVLLFVMVTGRPPWTCARRKDKHYTSWLDGTFAWPRDMHSDLKALLQGMLAPRPADRLSLEQVRANAWVSPTSRPSCRSHRRTSSTPEMTLGSRLARLQLTLSSDDTRAALLAGQPLTLPTAASASASPATATIAAVATADSRRSCSTMSDDTTATGTTPRPPIVRQQDRRRVRRGRHAFLATIVSPRRGPVKRRMARHGTTSSTISTPLSSPIGKRSTSCFLLDDRSLPTCAAPRPVAVVEDAAVLTPKPVIEVPVDGDAMLCVVRSPSHKKRRRFVVPSL